jgi:hypothetical protein
MPRGYGDEKINYPDSILHVSAYWFSSLQDALSLGMNPTMKGVIQLEKKLTNNGRTINDN